MSIKKAKTTKALSVYDYIGIAKRAPKDTSLEERAAWILDALGVSDDLCNYKHNAQQIEWALVSAYRATHPDCQSITLWVPQHSHTKAHRVCLLCGKKSSDISPTTPKENAGKIVEMEDKARHIEAFRECYSKSGYKTIDTISIAHG